METIRNPEQTSMLEFEKSGKVAVDFTVEGIGAREGGAPSGKMQMQHGH